VLGALVRAGLEGLRAKLPAPPLVEGDPAEMTPAQLAAINVRRLPDSLQGALRELENDMIVSSWLPVPLTEGYRSLKAAELEKIAGLDAQQRCSLYANYY
jgi:glutamine synthetase